MSFLSSYLYFPAILLFFSLMAAPLLAEPSPSNCLVRIVPTLHPFSIKNGEMLTVTAVIDSMEPIASVTADLGGLATIALAPIEPSSNTWSAQWNGENLEEKIYAVTITVSDVTGYSWTDHSLYFFDPAAGNSTVGGIEYPTGGMALVADTIAQWPDRLYGAGVIDTVNGYGYYGTYTTPGRVAKVALGAGDTAPSIIAVITLEPQEKELSSAVIDVENGYAYFGTYDSPARIIKVALGEGNAPPVRVASMTLEEGRTTLAAIDQPRGHAYFRTVQPVSKLIKVRLGEGDEPPSRVGSFKPISVEPYPGNLVGLALDSEGGYIYLGTTTSHVLKLKIEDGDIAPTFASIYSPSDTNDGTLTAGALDPTAGHVYFGGRNIGVVKFALGEGSDPPVRLGALTLSDQEKMIGCGVIDVSRGYAYFGTLFDNLVVKIGLNGEDGLPYLVGNVMAGRGSLHFAAIDPAAGYAYFESSGHPGLVSKIALGEGDSQPEVVGQVWMRDGLFNLINGQLDPIRNHLYYTIGSFTQPARIVKLALKANGQLPEQVGGLELAKNETIVSAAVIDPINNYGYFATETYPSHMVKVALGDDEGMLRVGQLPLTMGAPSAAALDANAGYAYFVGGGTLEKIALGSGDASPTSVGTLMMEASNFRIALLDVPEGFGYFGSAGSFGSSASSIVKVTLGAGDEPPTRVGAALLGDVGHLKSGVIIPASGHGYFATGKDGVGHVVKVALGEGSGLPSLIGSIALEGIGDFTSAFLHPDHSHAYFVSGALPNRMVKISFGHGSDLPAEVATFPMNFETSTPFTSSVYDAASGHAYIAARTNYGGGALARIAISHKGFLKASRFTMPEAGKVNDMRFHSHVAVGNLRLALYDNAETRNLLWQSGVIQNTAAGEDVVVPMAEGTPSSLVLNPGTYWAAWQVDTLADVPSYAAGEEASGFVFAQDFGPAPAVLAPSSVTGTSDVWTQYITYNEASIAGNWLLY